MATHFSSIRRKMELLSKLLEEIIQFTEGGRRRREWPKMKWRKEKGWEEGGIKS